MSAAELIFRDARESQILRLESEIEELRIVSNSRYHNLLDDMEGQRLSPVR